MGTFKFTHGGHVGMHRHRLNLVYGYAFVCQDADELKTLVRKMAGEGFRPDTLENIEPFCCRTCVVRSRKVSDVPNQGVSLLLVP